MKTLLLSLTCVTGLVASAHAQVFQPQTARNILIGSIAGAIIGENNDRPLEGALIGAAAGGLWSTVTVPAREQRSYAPPVPSTRVDSAPAYYGRASYCEPAPRRVIVVAPPRCEPPHRVVVLEPHCTPRHMVNRHHHGHDRRTVIVAPSRGRVVYVAPGYGHCR